MSTRMRSALPVVLWLVTLIAAIWLFSTVGAGRLAPPPVTNPSQWSSWAGDREPAEAIIAILRLVVLALAWYLVGVLTIGTLARLLRSARLVRWADALTIPLVRRGLEQALGLGLATAVVASAASAGVAQTPRHDPVIAAGTSISLAAPAEATPMSLQRLEDIVGTPVDGSSMALGGPSTSMTLQFEGLADGRAASLDLERIELAANQVVHDVVAGEHLWSIAHDHLHDQGLPTTDDDVNRYVSDVVAANRDQLVDPQNPDLILPGQQFILPTPSA